MGVGGMSGWKLQATSGAVRDDQVAHARALGTVTNQCPGCGCARETTSYPLPDGPFGRHHGLHLRCGTCGSIWDVDRSDEARVLDHLVPVP